MKFYIYAYNSEHCEGYNGNYEYPHVQLITDAWNDYYEYQTLFRAQLRINENECVWLGEVKILNGTNKITRSVIETEFENLSDEYCSLGQKIEYYKSLKDLREKGREKIAEDILISLNDIAFDKEKKRRFIEKFYSSGINTSLTRESEAYHLLVFGHSIYFNIDNKEQNNPSFTFSCKLKDLIAPHIVKFDFSGECKLPNRINLIVGKNGTGKTQILSELARYLSGYEKMDEHVNVDNRPFFSRYIAISYSAFDDFDILKEKDNNISNTLKINVEEGKNKFNDILSYIKVQRDSKKLNKIIDESLEDYYKKVQALYKNIEEFEEECKIFYENIEMAQNDEIDNQDNDIGENRFFSYVYCGLKSENRLLNDDEMINNFIESYNHIKRKNRQQEWKEILLEIIEQKNIIRNISNLQGNNYEEDIKKLFNQLSSGQKITVYIFTEVIENITDKSFLLIDEPEIHLHPNAVSNFMRMINMILNKFDSYAVIATHSPLIVQEIPSKYIRVFGSFGDDIPSIDKLYTECFGDNVSNIISYTFKVDPKESNYKTIIRELVEEGLSADDISNLFENKLSYNANIYLNSFFR